MLTDASVSLDDKVSPQYQHQDSCSSGDETDLDARRNSLFSPQLANLLRRKSENQKKLTEDQRLFLEKLESHHQLTSKVSMSSVISDR